MKLLAKSVIVGLILLVSYSPIHAAIIKDSETWYNVYLKDQKMGYQWEKIKNTKYQGRDAFLYKTRTFISMGLYFFSINVQVQDQLYLDKQCNPIIQTTTYTTTNKNVDSSTDEKTTYDIVYGRSSINCVVNDNGKTTKTTTPISKGADLRILWQIAMGVNGFLPGKTYKIFVYYPTEVNIGNYNMKIGKSVLLDSGKRRYYEGDLVDKKGSIQDLSDLFKEQSAASFLKAFNTEPTSQDEAVKGLGPYGTYLTIGIPVDNKLPKVGEISELTVLLTSDYDRKVKWPIDSRQSVKQTEGNRTAEFKISARSYDANKSVLLPIKDPIFNDYLSESPGLEVNNPEISDFAKKIIGPETNAYKAACLLREWVANNISAYMNEHKTSALMTLHEKKGVCSDSAVLYAALARAVGIPTEFAAGLVYDAEDGVFINHVWVECYVGEWIPLDPTLQTNFVDATHIKMEESPNKTIADALPEANMTNTNIKIIANTVNASNRPPQQNSLNEVVFDLPKPKGDGWTSETVSYTDGEFLCVWFKKDGDGFIHVQKGRDGKIIRYRSKGGSQRNPPAEWLEPME